MTMRVREIEPGVFVLEKRELVVQPWDPIAIDEDKGRLLRILKDEIHAQPSAHDPNAGRRARLQRQIAMLERDIDDTGDPHVVSKLEAEIAEAKDELKALEAESTTDDLPPAA